MSEDCIFCKIVAGSIPSTKVYEDDLLLAFKDIHPVAPVHVLVIPKVHIASLLQVEPEHGAAFAQMFVKIPEIARDLGLHDGFRTIINTGRVGRQDVPHVHAHIIGGAERLPFMLANES